MYTIKQDGDRYDIFDQDGEWVGDSLNKEGADLLVKEFINRDEILNNDIQN